MLLATGLSILVLMLFVWVATALRFAYLRRRKVRRRLDAAIAWRTERFNDGEWRKAA